MSKKRKNVRKVPSELRLRLSQINGNIVVASARLIKRDDIAQGQLAHLQIAFVDGELSFPTFIEPPAMSGRYSRYNRVGREIVRRDLPKVIKTWSAETPNFGDEVTYGTHTVTFAREVYQRDFVPPKHLTIHIKLIGQDVVNEEYALAFTVSQELTPATANFEADWLYALNVLLENVGGINILRPNADDVEYMATVRNVPWEILPPGEGEVRLAQIVGGVAATNPAIRQAIQERFDFFNSLPPHNTIIGQGALEGYIGAQIKPNLVVFDNYLYGNAVYIMFENWETLSQKSRTELFKSYTSQYIRIRHTGDWKQAVLDAIAPYIV